MLKANISEETYANLKMVNITKERNDNVTVLFWDSKPYIWKDEDDNDDKDSDTKLHKNNLH